MDSILNSLYDPAKLVVISPQIALAIAEGVQMAPMVLACKYTFSATTPSNSGPIALENGQGATISQAALMVGIEYQVDQPSANSGNFLKPVSDYFYGLQSGISATVDVVGTPRYPVCSYYEPLKIVKSCMDAKIATGWLLNGTQSIKMQFSLDIASLLTVPTTVTFAFNFIQPVGTDRYTYMSSMDAANRLKSMGVNVPDYVLNRTNV